MIELNHIFLFLAVVSPLIVLARSCRPGWGYRGWRVAAVLVLGITGVAWVLLRPEAGYIGGSAWLALLFLPAIGLRRMSELFERQQYRSARRLATAIQLLHPSAELRDEISLLRNFESRQAAGLTPPPLASRSQTGGIARTHRFWKTPAVAALIVINVLAFLVELSFGSSTAGDVLDRLGALEPQFVLNGEYWRLLTALFLHAGPIHLLFNLFALYVLGPPLEDAIGSIRFVVCYLISGLGSSAGVVALTKVGLIHPDLLVGASGSVMGIVGAWAGFLLSHRHTPLGRERLRNVLMIVAIQIAFDLTTPQISKSAHLCGLAVGFLVGLIISPRTQGRGD